MITELHNKNINELKEIVHAFNPKNNQRRVQRGRVAIPETTTINIFGLKKLYSDKHNSLPGIPKIFTYSFDVRSTYVHFFDKVRYKKLYSLTDKELDKKGYERFNHKNRDGTYVEVIRRIKKGFRSHPDLPYRKKTYVLVDDVSNKIEIPRKERTQ